jgi:pimeloyl-ACP methyl ester carboxylesterase
MGLYDVPALAKYIQEIKNNNKIKITYIGHSQGTAQYFSGMTLLPEFYLNNFTGIIALGPVTNLANIKALPIRVLAKLYIDKLLSELGFTEMFENSAAADKLALFLCSNFNLVCAGFLEILVDKTVEDDDEDRSLVLLAHYPSGASLKAFMHFAESIRNKSFANMDNIPYDLSKAKGQRISLIVGSADLLATPEDNRIFKSDLEKLNMLDFYKEYENIGHGTFLYSKSNKFMDDILKKVKEYSNLN